MTIYNYIVWLPPHHKCLIISPKKPVIALVYENVVGVKLELIIII